jgi:hypothetical protein
LLVISWGKRALGGTGGRVAVVFVCDVFVGEGAAWCVGLACVAPLAGAVLVCGVALEPVPPVADWVVLAVVALVASGVLVAVFACVTVFVVVLDPQPVATSTTTTGILKRERQSTAWMLDDVGAAR